MLWTAAGLLACGRIDLGSRRLATEPAGASEDGGATPRSLAPLPTGKAPPGGASVLPPSNVTAPLAIADASVDASDGITSEHPAFDAGLDAGDTSPGLGAGPPSCRGALELCGPNSDSCCLSLPVAGGPSALPIDAAGTRVQVEVSSFYLDKYEVTVGRFREFLASYDGWRELGNPAPGAGSHPRAAGSGWRASDDASLPATAAELERLVRECNTIPLSTLDLPNSSSRIPLNCVTWAEAAAFCAWDGARLPTYAEWYHAAAGGALDLLYPWGNEPTPSRLYASYGCTLGVERPECNAAYVLPVGSHTNGAGHYAHEDLAGSMTEWLLDGALEPFVDGCVDCVGLSADHRFWKSGSWVDIPESLKNTYFAIVEPILRLPFLGFRCARDAP